jgi:hypothetical protein
MPELVRPPELRTTEVPIVKSVRNTGAQFQVNRKYATTSQNFFLTSNIATQVIAKE